MSNLAENIPRDHAPGELSSDRQAAIEALVERDGGCLVLLINDWVPAPSSATAETRRTVQLSAETKSALMRHASNQASDDLQGHPAWRPEMATLSGFFRAAKWRSGGTPKRATSRPRSSRAPQRAKRGLAKQAAAQSSATSGADEPPPGDDPPRRSARQREAPASVGARLVNQRTAPEVLGWPGRRFIDFVERKSVPHVVDRRLFIAKVEDVLRALGLAETASVAKVEAIVDWRARAELKLVGGLRGER
jgi:hypothetical protein